ncbi:MAG: hypothetical protein KAT37_01680 [Candidatus Aenigmarchaeota archaeon]|nr:hypothetical protein [Candidatus Aenigmarchaeota archaeon]
MKNKGQYFTLEQMILLLIGTIITISIYFSLVTVNESIKELTEEDQMYEIGKLISSEINRAYHSPEEITLTFNIPKKISGKGYRIYIENVGEEYNLTIKLGKNSEEKIVIIPLDSEYQASGMLFSSVGEVKIMKLNDKILIKGRF